MKWVDRELKNGVYVTHVLMDKRFTCPKIIDRFKKIGIHEIGMVKNGNTNHLYQDRLYTLADLFQKSVEEYYDGAIISSIAAHLQAKTSIIFQGYFLISTYENRNLFYLLFLNACINY